MVSMAAFYDKKGNYLLDALIVNHFRILHEVPNLVNLLFNDKITTKAHDFLQGQRDILKALKYHILHAKNQQSTFTNQ